MSNDSSNVPILKEHIQNALAKPYVSQWTLADDYQGYGGIHVIHGTGKPATVTDPEVIRGRGELSRRESYGHDIYGPAIPFPSKDGGPV